MSPVTVTLTAAQARVAIRALGLYLDVSEDEDDRSGYGITGRDRNIASKALTQLMRATPPKEK